MVLVQRVICANLSRLTIEKISPSSEWLPILNQGRLKAVEEEDELDLVYAVPRTCWASRDPLLIQLQSYRKPFDGTVLFIYKTDSFKSVL